MKFSCHVAYLGMLLLLTSYYWVNPRAIQNPKPSLEYAHDWPRYRRRRQQYALVTFR
jgi:hypothetical protein